MSNLKRGNWSTHELERLRALFPKSPAEHVARLLRRSVSSVERKAREIFRAPQVARPWSGDDEIRLREGFGVLDLEVLCLVLGRPRQDITGRIEDCRRELRTGAWSRVERNFLKRIYGSRSDEDLVVCTSRPLSEIQTIAEELCLSKDKGFLARRSDKRRPMPRWTTEDIALLRDDYPHQSNLDLARRLDRSVASVANKANQLGLRKAQDVLREMGRRNVATRYDQA